MKTLEQKKEVETALKYGIICYKNKNGDKYIGRSNRLSLAIFNRIKKSQEYFSLSSYKPNKLDKNIFEAFKKYFKEDDTYELTIKNILCFTSNLYLGYHRDFIDCYYQLKDVTSKCYLPTH